MKTAIFLISWTFIFLVANGAALGQKGCEFNIVGVWQSASPGESKHTLYSFEPGGTVKVLSHSWSGQKSQAREIARATYKLNSPKSPKIIEFTAIKEGGIIEKGTTSIEIVQYDDAKLTALRHGSEPIRLVKLDPYRYFLVFAARLGSLRYGGPTFAMTIKTDGRQTQIDTFGVYFAETQTIAGPRTDKLMGPIPDAIRNEFMNDIHTDSDTMLRLEVTPAEFERSQRLLRGWQWRAREHHLLYSVPYLNNIVFLEELAKALNNCGERIQLYKLTWDVDDQIIAEQNLTQVAFYYIKELRQLNDSLHVTDDKFRHVTGLDNLRPRGPAKGESNVATSVLRLLGETNIATACRKYAARPELALTAVGVRE
jgi:hypothetical protein